jgi:hypothetical protein
METELRTEWLRNRDAEKLASLFTQPDNIVASGQCR